MFNEKSINTDKSFCFKPVLTQKYFEGEPLEIGNDSQLVLGDVVIEDAYRITHEQQAPRLYSDKPVLEFDQIWEKGGDDLESIMYDEEEGIFKTWYRVRHVNTTGYDGWEKKLHKGYIPGALCYAESKDMIHWTKPEFDFCPIPGAEKNNICYHGCDMGCDCGRIFRNPDKENKEMKYISVYFDGYGVHLSSSPDGRVWREHSDVNPLIPVSFDTYMHMMYDAERKKFLLYLRPAVFAKHESVPAEPVCINLNYRRRITVSESSDLIHWSTPRIVQHAPETAILDQADNQNTFAVGSHVLGRMSRFRVDVYDDAVNQKKQEFWTFGPDPYHMSFLDRVDDRMPCCIEADGSESNLPPHIMGYPIYADDRTYFPINYSKVDPDTGKVIHGMNYAYFGENRFVARVADEYGGWLLTREFYLRGNELEINCEVGEGGSITAEIVYGAGGCVRGGQYVSGYRVEDCDPITTDGVHQVLKWNGSSDLSAFRDKALYIRFHIMNAKLYSFKVNDFKKN